MAKAKKTEAVVDTPESKIAEISKDLVGVEKEASKIVIKNKKDYDKASVFLSSKIKLRINRIKEIMDFFIKPHKEARKKALEEMNKIEALFEKQIEPLLRIEQSIKSGMSGYLREQEEIARKEEARLAALRVKQDERREDKGLAPISTPLPSIERPETLVRSEDGSRTSASKVWKFEVENYSLLSRDVQARVFDLAREKGLVDRVIGDLIREGARELTGVRIYEDFDIKATASKF